MSIPLRHRLFTVPYVRRLLVAVAVAAMFSVLLAARTRPAMMRGAHLRLADLEGAQLPGAVLERAHLKWSNLRGSDLGEANLRHADMEAANLGQANLSWAKAAHADLRNANLGGANLGHADLTGANLCGAYLDGANLRDSTLCGARFDEFTQWPAGFDPELAGAQQVCPEGARDASATGHEAPGAGIVEKRAATMDEHPLPMRQAPTRPAHTGAASTPPRKAARRSSVKMEW